MKYILEVRWGEAFDFLSINMGLVFFRRVILDYPKVNQIKKETGTLCRNWSW